MSAKIGLRSLALPALERLSLRQAARIPHFRPSLQRPIPFFQPSSTRRLLSVQSMPFPGGPSASATRAAVQAVPEIPRSLPNWLFGCSALVFGIVVIGGLTRLTESGLSITEWNPITGIRPPITDAEWDVEWEKYRISPEGIL